MVPTRLPRSLVLLALAGLAVLASGCLVQSVSVRQEVGGPVVIDVQLCQRDDFENTMNSGFTLECDPAQGDPSPTPAVLKTGGTQFFLGLLVPDGSTPRDAVMSGGLTGPLTFSQELSDAFAAASAPPVGRKWLGFKTGALQNGTTNTAKLVARFDPPASAAGTNVPYQALVAGRPAANETEANQPIPSPLPLILAIPAIAGTQLSGEVPVRDVSLAPASAVPVDARRGQTVAVPFVASYRGTTGSGLLPLSAATTLPGATAAPDVSPLQFASTGTAPLRANVAIPPGAPLGLHNVTLALPLADGGTRTATGQVRVVADPAPPAPPAGGTSSTQSSAQPQLTAAQIRSLLSVVAFRSTRRGTVLRDGLRFEQTFPGPGAAVWELRTRGSSARVAQAGRRLARLTRTITRAGTQRVTLRLTRAGRRAARRGRRAPVVLRTTFTPTGRSAITASKNLTLRR